jgi:hypothetical protein
MSYLTHITSATAAVVLPFAGLSAEEQYTYFQSSSDIATSFTPPRTVSLSSEKIGIYQARNQISESSSASLLKINVTSISTEQTTQEQSPAQLAQEFKRLSGLTWINVAAIFDVASRSALSWASGKPVSEKNHEKLGIAVAALRKIDRGTATENRNLFFSEAVTGRTYLDLFTAGEFETAKKLAGPGKGRPQFGRILSNEAKKYNARNNFGRLIDEAVTSDESEIVPVGGTKTRRAKARRNTV